MNLLVFNENWVVRRGLAENPNTPPETLVQLASDENCDVRCAVARNLNTPIETLVHLASDEHWYVRWGVANNPNTPNYIKKTIQYKKVVNCYE